MGVCSSAQGYMVSHFSHPPHLLEAGGSVSLWKPWAPSCCALLPPATEGRAEGYFVSITSALCAHIGHLQGMGAGRGKLGILSWLCR